jgi:hypothetical protein
MLYPPSFQKSETLYYHTARNPYCRRLGIRCQQMVPRVITATAFWGNKRNEINDVFDHQ